MEKLWCDYNIEDRSPNNHSFFAIIAKSSVAVEQGSSTANCTGIAEEVLPPTVAQQSYSTVSEGGTGAPCSSADG